MSDRLGVALLLTDLRSRFSNDCFSPVSAPSPDTRLMFWSSPRSCPSIFFIQGRDVNQNGTTHRQHSHETQAAARCYNSRRQFHCGPDGLCVYGITLNYKPRRTQTTFFLSTLKKLLCALDVDGHHIGTLARIFSRLWRWTIGTIYASNNCQSWPFQIYMRLIKKSLEKAVSL